MLGLCNTPGNQPTNSMLQHVNNRLGHKQEPPELADQGPGCLSTPISIIHSAFIHSHNGVPQCNKLASPEPADQGFSHSGPGHFHDNPGTKITVDHSNQAVNEEEEVLHGAQATTCNQPLG
jgi:hypothetical protein